MERYEYKVIAAPAEPALLDKLPRDADAFVVTLNVILDAAGLEGWDFLRAERLPCHTRRWFGRSRHEVRDMLVFRRALPPIAAAVEEAERKVRTVSARRISRDDVVERVRKGDRRIAVGAEAGLGVPVSATEVSENVPARSAPAAAAAASHRTAPSYAAE